jgi:hypothetical protein
MTIKKPMKIIKKMGIFNLELGTKKTPRLMQIGSARLPLIGLAQIAGMLCLKRARKRSSAL